MSNYKDRSLAKYELDVLFTEIFNPIQCTIIARILKILGKYKLLTNDMLFKIYLHEYGENLKLKYLERAVKEYLIIKYKYNHDEKDFRNKSEKDIYFYSLKRNSYQIMEMNRENYFSMPYFLEYEDRNRILNFNNFLIENDIWDNFDYRFSSFWDYRFFMMEDDVIYYYEDVIDEYEIDSIMLDTDVVKYRKIENERVRLTYFKFKKIKIDNLDLIDFGEKTTAMNPKNV